MVIFWTLIILALIWGILEFSLLTKYYKKINKTEEQKDHSKIHMLYIFFYELFIFFLFMWVIYNNLRVIIDKSFFLQWGVVFFIINIYILFSHMRNERLNNFKS